MKLKHVPAWLRRLLGGPWLPLKMGLAVAAVVLAAQALGLFAPLDEHVLDLHFAWRGALPPSGKVAVVGIGHRCTRQDRLGPWPWPRARHAELIDRLHAAGAKAICFDLYFPDRLGQQAPARPEGQPDDDDGRRAMAQDTQLMAAAAQRAGNVALAVFKRETLRRDPVVGPLTRVDHIEPNAEPLARATLDGHINVRDGTVRRVPAGFLYRDPQGVERRCFQLGVLGAALGMGVRPEQIRVGRRGLWLGDHFVPVDRAGNLLVSYYRFPDQCPPYFVSAILRGEVDPAVFRDKVVFVGQTIHGERDADLIMTPEGMRFGVYVQAIVADNLLNGRRPLRRAGPRWLAAALLVLSLACAWRLFKRRVLGKLVWSVALAAAAVLASHFVFERLSLLVDLTPCLAVVALNLGAALAVGVLLADKEVARHDKALALLAEAGRLSADGVGARISERIVANIGRAMGAEGCALFVRDAGGSLVLSAHDGFAGELGVAQAAAAARAANRWVAREHRAYFAAEASHGDAPPLADPRMATVLIVPLVAHDELYGTLALFNKRPSEISPTAGFGDQDLRLLTLLTQQAAMTLERACLADELRRALHSLEEAQEKLIEGERLSAVGRMANMIIHDIKNPMQGVRLFAEMAGEAGLADADRREFSRTMCHEIDRLVGLCQEILDFARGTSSLLKRAVAFDDFLRDVLVALGPELERRGVALEVDLACGDTARVDANRIKRVVLNLCRNAVEAVTGSADARLTVLTARRADRVHIEIADNGPGIPEEIADTAFDPFVTHGKEHGTGLGLAIAKKIVEDHGGTIDFTTAAGHGTTFTIELPA